MDAEFLEKLKQAPQSEERERLLQMLGSTLYVDVNGQVKGCLLYTSDNMRRWFLHNFQKRVEGTAAEHVYLINDINAVFADRRGKPRFLPQLANVLNAVVACRVNFRNIQQRTLLNASTGGAFQAG